MKAYQEDGELTTTLFEGKVRTSVGKDEVILKPDESLSFDKSSRRMIVSDDLAAYAGCGRIMSLFLREQRWKK